MTITNHQILIGFFVLLSAIVFGVVAVARRRKNKSACNVEIDRASTDIKDSAQISLTSMVTFSPEEFGDSGPVGTFIKVVDGEKEGSKEKATRKISLQPHNDNVLKQIYANGWALDSVTVEDFRPISMSACQRVYKAFKPKRAIMTEIVWATYSGKGLPDIVLSETVQDAADMLLTSMFCGAENCFPYAPCYALGIAGPAFAPPGVEVSWPTVNGGIDLSASFAVEQTVLSRAQGSLPEGYGLTPTSVKVQVRLTLFGPSL